GSVKPKALTLHQRAKAEAARRRAELAAMTEAERAADLARFCGDLGPGVFGNFPDDADLDRLAAEDALARGLVPPDPEPRRQPAEPSAEDRAWWAQESARPAAPSPRRQV